MQICAWLRVLSLANMVLRSNPTRAKIYVCLTIVNM